MRFMFFLFFILKSCFVYGSEIIIKEIQLESDNRQEAYEKALNEISHELVIETLGENKYIKDKKRIEKYIIKNKNRYILSTQSSSPTLQDNGKFLFTITIKVSRKNLKKALLKHNLFYSSKGTSCILPMLSFSSYFTNKKKTYSWWLKSDQDSLLKQMAGSFFNLLSREFIKYGFYTLNPVFQKMNQGTPAVVLPKKYSQKIKNFIPLAQFYSCDIVLFGHVKIGQLSSDTSLTPSFFSFSKTEELPSVKNWTYFSFNVFNIQTRQFLFKLKNQFPFSLTTPLNPQEELLLRSKHILESLTYQITSYHEEGSLSLNRLMISVQGSLNYAEIEQFKKSLIKNISGIQNLEERLLTSNRIVYLAESSHSITSLARQIQQASFPFFIVQLKGTKKRELEIYVKKRK